MDKQMIRDWYNEPSSGRTVYDIHIKFNIPIEEVYDILKDK